MSNSHLNPQGGILAPEFKGLNCALNPYPTSELESEKAKIQVQRNKIGNVSREVSTEVHMWRRDRCSEKDQASVNLRGTGLEKPTRKDKEEFTGEERKMDCKKS